MNNYPQEVQDVYKALQQIELDLETLQVDMLYIYISSMNNLDNPNNPDNA